MKETWIEQLFTYEHFEGVEHLRHMAGFLFEAMAQCQLQEEVALNLIPMMKQQTGKETAQWTSQPRNVPTAPDSMGQGSGSMGADAANALIPVKFKFKPEDVVQYAGSKLETFRPGVFYVPESSHQVAFDSFILADGVLHNACLKISRDRVAFRLYYPPWGNDRLLCIGQHQIERVLG